MQFVAFKSHFFQTFAKLLTLGFGFFKIHIEKYQSLANIKKCEKNGQLIQKFVNGSDLFENLKKLMIFS